MNERRKEGRKEGGLEDIFFEYFAGKSVNDIAQKRISQMMLTFLVDRDIIMISLNNKFGVITIV
jgi:hypothetical protein